jgi:predicted Zn-dependent protease
VRNARSIISVFLVLAAAMLGGCEINPETGKVVFNVVPPDDEREIGSEAHKQVLAEFGGVYYDPALADYVERIGQKLVKQSEFRKFDYRFTILDSPEINAFALPGGYIYVTRGLLALLGSEAELAAVLGHELAHVKARHGAQRLSRMKFEERFCSAFVCDFELPVLGDMAQVGLDLAFGGFTKAQELESDDLGIFYMQRAGYDPLAMASFLRKLKAQAELEAEAAGLTPGQQKAKGYSSTHPLTEDRIAKAIELTEPRSAVTGERGEWDYLANIDGLLYGNRREYGFVIGNSFLHPIRQIAFDAPDDYRLYPDSRRVTGIGRNGAIMLFEPSRRLVRGSMLDYLKSIWAEGVALRDARSLMINGMDAATAWIRQETKRGLVDFRLVAIRADTGIVYRFLFISPASMTRRVSEGMREITYSFRTIDAEQAQQLKPRRIRIVGVGNGDSVFGFAARSRFRDNAIRRFSILNGIEPGAKLKPGRIVKIVTE